MPNDPDDDSQLSLRLIPIKEFLSNIMSNCKRGTAEGKLTLISDACRGHGKLNWFDITGEMVTSKMRIPSCNTALMTFRNPKELELTVIL